MAKLISTLGRPGAWLLAVFAALAATLVLSGPAMAQEVKYKRTTPKINIKVEQTERTQGLKNKPAAKKEIVPEITADAFMNIETAVKAMKVVDPQGRTWRVSRRWMP